MKRTGTMIIAILCLAIQAATPATKTGTRLAGILQTGATTTPLNVWVSFADKGPSALQKPVDPLMLVSPRSLQRRQNVRPAGSLVDETDLPLPPSYVDAVLATGATMRQQSKWFNAVSVSASTAQIREIALLPFVREIELLGSYGRRSPEESLSVPDPAEPSLRKNGGTHSLDYGPSLTQVQQISVPAVHELGNHAEGVIVGVFDNGFRLPNHEVFSSMHIIATHDFVDHKTSVVPSNPSTSFGDHGVKTLSVIGGYKSGQLIGPAYGASFILARTENDSSETPVEEDNWLAAMEWADSLGVQVTSTSLGYLTFDAPYTSWTWENMNGRTTLISRAAAMAVRKGIVVVNSAGNEGLNATHNTLDAPADADSVVAVAAVTSTGDRSGFSSVGPSTSVPAQTKPDVAAMGTGDYFASAVSPTGYGTGNGTSYACPLAAGVAALLVKAAPSATPMMIVNAMKSTASNASNPNNLIGWGILNAKAALDLLTPPPAVPGTFVLHQNFPNPFNPTTVIGFDVPGPAAAHVRLAVYDLLGREVAVLADQLFSPGYYTRGLNGKDLASGVYVCRLEGGGSVQSKKMLLVR
jgi:serine protease AprX